MVRHTRFELVTTRLKVVCSTNWANDANGVTDGDRTRDNQCHKLALYQLNYSHHYYKVYYYSHLFFKKMERETRVELATFSLEGWRSTNWATPALFVMVGVAGFEPATPCSQGRCATELRYTPLRLFFVPFLSDR